MMAEGARDIREIAAALRKVTEALAARPAEGALAAWGEFEWRIAAAVCGLHGIAALLREEFRGRAPPRFEAFLDEQLRHAAARHARISGLLASLDAGARAHGVGLVGLKGAALHARGAYAPGLRPMGDIDVLAAPQDLPAIAPLLAGCGYGLAFSTRRHEVYRPLGAPHVPVHRLGEHIDNPIKIEVHTRIAEPLPLASIDLTTLIMPAVPPPGLAGYPSDAALLGHLALHAAGNMRARALRLIQLRDLALVARSLDARGWHEALESGCLGWWALPPLRLMARYHPDVLPREVETRLMLGCPWPLRRHSQRACASQVSWSQIRIEAFPGIEWSRTPLEALRFMLARALPSRSALRELRSGAAQIPDAAAVPWYGLSHSARIARWIFGRPPRVQTLLSVRTALESPDL